MIGCSWAMLFASGGYKVSMYDISPSQLEVAASDISCQLQDLDAKSLLKGTLNVDEQLKLITFSQDIKESVKGAIHVQVDSYNCTLII